MKILFLPPFSISGSAKKFLKLFLLEGSRPQAAGNSSKRKKTKKFQL